MREIGLRRRWFAAVTLLALVNSAAGFDTFWHSTVSHKVGNEFAFSADAANIMQLGNFSVDFFGPIGGLAGEHVTREERAALQAFGGQNIEVRAAAIFLHFDNLGGELDQNAKFDSIFARLLHATQVSLAEAHARPDLNDGTRKAVILITLGASLHAVQDFYSHSDWIHNNFDATAAKMIRLSSGELRAPSWFEVRDKLGDPARWPFQVSAGIYPPVLGKRNTHTHMNHDNSRLVYREEESAGKPLMAQARYHNAGPMPARPGDAASILRHQQLAVNTAIAASIEWVKKVEDNAEAKAAIESAKNWNLATDNPDLVKEYRGALALQVALSCAAGRWDGEDLPPEQRAFCRPVSNQGIGSLLGASRSQLEAQLLGLAGVAIPQILGLTGKFWDVQSRYDILERLTRDIGSDSGHYRFASK
jgi:hypothetical protein